MRYAIALLFVLSWIPVQAQEVNNIGRLANALSIDAECTWLPNDKGDYLFDCGEYHDFTLFKMQVGGFINRSLPEINGNFFKSVNQGYRHIYVSSRLMTC